ncbi:MAG TPA: hypothetical protein VFQ44_14340 [Streptosporangiaceae bacterium]|nr:hypothetical protein [Streptosporangiaceae bacterium]
MSDLALLTWVITVLGGLFLLAIWLIEYDPDFQRAAATRLPVPIISTHATLAIAGLGVWVTYLITDDDDFAYATLAILAGTLTLGITLAVRWVRVYRTSALPKRSAVLAGAGAGGGAGGSGGAGLDVLVPPERHFPLAVVISHGVFAFTTVILVLASTLGELFHGS